jgi:hypothetical protein
VQVFVETWDTDLSIDIYIIAVAILGAIVVYPEKNMSFIDALFFCTGSATQSGLNTSVYKQWYTYELRDQY